MIPLPVALLLRRARNAKSPMERHHTAYFAWEASVRIAAAFRMPADVSAFEQPSIGQFVSCLRDSADITTHSALLDCFRLFAEQGVDRHPQAKSITVAKLLEFLPAYRNKLIGHGAARESAFYEPASRVLLEGLEAAWNEGIFLPHGARLVVIESVEPPTRGSLAAQDVQEMRLLDLCAMGQSIPPRLSNPHLEAEGRALPTGVCLQEDGILRTAHPWLVFDRDEFRERILFFNGRSRRAPKYLDYVSGEHVRSNVLVGRIPEIENDVRLAFRGTTGPEPEELPEDPNEFGDYRLVSRLGEGGMGVVYLATQESLAGRTVALKMLPEGCDSDAIAVARFQREIAALSKCDHPNVVKILASGVCKGRHYYAMELVEGPDLSAMANALAGGASFDLALSTASGTLHQKAATTPEAPAPRRAGSLPAIPKPESVRSIVLLFRDAARALHHIHQQGIVHRDVKPANLVVTEADHRVVVMDLGLAAVRDASRSLTRDGAGILGTLRYMAPEQLQRSVIEVDHRADIYGLGATFYELLTGRPVFDGDTEMRLVEQVLHEDRVHPSIANPRLPVDLQTILAKATEKDPKIRYASAEALASDVDAFLDGRPISARPPTASYLLSLFLRRHRALVATGFAAFVFLSVGLVGYVMRERSLREEADRHRAIAESQRVEAQLQQARAQESSVALFEEQGREELLRGNSPRAAWLLQQAYRGGRPSPASRFMLAESLRHLDSPVSRFTGHLARICCVAFSPEGGRIASAGDDGHIAIWDPNTGRTIRTLTDSGQPIERVSWSENGDRILAVGRDLSVRIWNVADASIVAATALSFRPLSIRLSGDGTSLVAANPSGAIEVWSGAPLRRIQSITTVDLRINDAWFHGSGLAAITRDGQHLSWGADGGVESSDGGLPGSEDSGSIVGAVVTADAGLQDERSPGPIPGAAGHTTFDSAGGLNAVTVDRRMVVVTRPHHGGGRRWSAPTATTGAWFAFTPDGSLLVSPDYTVYDARTGAVVVPAGSKGRLRLQLVTPCDPMSCDGRYLVNPASGSVVDLFTGRARSQPPKKLMPIRSMAISDDGNIAAALGDGRVAIWETQSGATLAEISDFDGDVPQAVAFLGNAALLGVGKTSIYRWDPRTGRRDWHHSIPKQGIAVAKAFRDRARIAVADTLGQLYILDATSGSVLQTFKTAARAVNALDISPDGDSIVLVGAAGYSEVWTVRGGEPTASMIGHAGHVYAASFAVDGRRIATGGADGTVRVWDGATGKELARYRERGIASIPPGDIDGGDRPVRGLAFSPDGSLLAVGTDGAVSVLDVSLEQRPPPQIDEVLQGLPLPWRLVDGRFVQVEVGRPSEHR